MAFICELCNKELEGNRELFEHYVFNHKDVKHHLHMIITKRYIPKCVKCKKLIIDHNDKWIIGGDDGGNAVYVHWNCATPEEQKWMRDFKDE